MFNPQIVGILFILIVTLGGVAYYIKLGNDLRRARAVEADIENRYEAAVAAGLIPRRERVCYGMLSGLAALMSSGWLRPNTRLTSKKLMLENLDKGRYVDYPNNMPVKEEAA